MGKLLSNVLSNVLSKVLSKVLILILLISILSFSVNSEVETPIGTFTVTNSPPPTPHSWTPISTHNKSQIFSWTEGTDDNSDAISTYICVTNDTDSDICSVVNSGLSANPSYTFTQSENFWDYTWGSASRTYYVKLTPNDGTTNGTANASLSFTLTNALPTISVQNSNASSDGDKNVGETISFFMNSHADTDSEDKHNLRVCKTNSINSSGECDGGEYCNEHNSTYSTDSNLACDYTAVDGDGTSNTAYFFVCDCAPDDNTCPGQCSLSASHTFYVNHAPSVSNGDLLPNSPASSDTITCNYTFSDTTDSDNEGSSTYKWFNYTGGAWEDSGLTGVSLANSKTRTNEIWKCEITPIDEHGFLGSPINSSNETIFNSPPDQPSGFMIQDGAQDWDAENYTTHDLTPNLNWTTSDSDGDSVSVNICIANSEANRNSGTCVYSGTSSNGSVRDVSGLDYLGTNRQYFVKLTPNDGSENGTYLNATFNLTNNLVNIPSSLSPIDTHNQTPQLNWSVSDPDDGNKDKWPADTVISYIRVGTSYGDGTYENNNNANSDGEIVDNPIPWGTPGAVYANTTAYVSIWAGDSNGANSTPYNITINLYDYLPNITDIEMTDGGSLYSSCLKSTCALTPVEHSNASVSVRVTAIDTDNDCDQGSNSHAKIYLCLSTTSCSPSTGNYSWQIDSISRSGSVCTYTFSTNKTAADSTPEFFRTPSSSRTLYVNLSSQAGARTIDLNRNATWTYGTLKAISYSNTITLGDGSINLNAWNDGTTVANMINWGNDVLNLVWSITNPQSGDDIWNLTGSDFMLDDDNSQSSEASGYLAPIYLNQTTKTFEPGSGLEVCSSGACSDPTLNETLATYFHVKPPLGLKAGIYNTTITVTIS